jgi:hypothetical protein
MHRKMSIVRESNEYQARALEIAAREFHLDFTSWSCAGPAMHWCRSMRSCSVNGREAKSFQRRNGNDAT